MEERIIETDLYGNVQCTIAFDPDASFNGEGYIEMHNEDGGYLGNIYGVAMDELTPEIVEEQIEENLYY